jgi:hypothetical protein
LFVFLGRCRHNRASSGRPTTSFLSGFSLCWLALVSTVPLLSCYH